MIPWYRLLYRTIWLSQLTLPSSCPTPLLRTMGLNRPILHTMYTSPHQCTWSCHQLCSQSSVLVWWSSSPSSLEDSSTFTAPGGTWLCLVNTREGVSKTELSLSLLQSLTQEPTMTFPSVVLTRFICVISDMCQHCYSVPLCVSRVRNYYKYSSPATVRYSSVQVCTTTVLVSAPSGSRGIYNFALTL